MINRLLAIPVILVLLGSSLAYSDEAVNNQFAEANRFYEEKQFDSAITVYNAILDQGLQSAPLHFNLGNAYFRNGDLGHGILCYLRARKLDPTDQDIVANLEFARRFTSVQMEGVALNPVSTLLESIVEPYHLNTLAWAASALFISLVLLFTLRFGLGFRAPALRTGIVALLILLVSASWLTTIKYRHDYLTRRAVIVADQSVVWTGPSEHSDKELDGAPGLVVEVLGESGDFYNVLFENKRRGWILKSLVAVV